MVIDRGVYCLQTFLNSIFDMGGAHVRGWSGAMESVDGATKDPEGLGAGGPRPKQENGERAVSERLPESSALDGVCRQTENDLLLEGHHQCNQGQGDNDRGSHDLAPGNVILAGA